MKSAFAPRRPQLVAAPLAAVLALGCAQTSPAPGDVADPPPQDGCPPEHVAAPQGGCMPVGVQGCAPHFLGSDNLCHPSADLCEPGTIPDFSEGCLPVGIPRCDPSFLGEDGLCRPSMARCPPGTFALPQEGCVPIDGPSGCGTGAWGDIPDAPGNVYVDPSSPDGGGDGSRARPLRTIAEAMERVQAGGRVALAEGVYDEPVVIRKSIELAGRCPSKVWVQGTYAGVPYPVHVGVLSAAGVTIRGIGIGGDGTAIRALNARDLVIERVHTRDASGVAIALLGTGTTASVKRSLIEATRPDPSGAYGIGIELEGGAHLTMESSVVADSGHVGVFVISDDAGGDAAAASSADIRASLIEGLRRRHDTGYPGVQGSRGSSVHIAESAVLWGSGPGLFASLGSSVTATGILIEGTTFVTPSLFNCGAQAVRGGAVTVLGSALVRVGSAGFCANGQGSTGILRDSLVQDTLPDELGEKGQGAAVDGGATMTLTGNLFLRNTDFGIVAAEAGSHLEATRNLVQDTLPGPATGTPADNGVGIAVVSAASAELTSNAVVRSQVVGVLLQNDATLTARNNLVEDTQPQQGSGDYGWGVHLGNSSAELTSEAVLGNRDIGVFTATTLLQTASLTMTDSLVEGTLPRASDEDGGVGVMVSAAKLTMRSSIVRRSVVAGVLSDVGATLEMRGCLVDEVGGGTISNENTGMVRPNVGDGVLALGIDALDMVDTTITGAARAGLLALHSDGSLTNVRVTRNRFGLVLQEASQVSVSPDCEITGNSEQDQTSDGDFPLPSAASPLP